MTQFDDFAEIFTMQKKIFFPKHRIFFQKAKIFGREK